MKESTDLNIDESFVLFMAAFPYAKEAGPVMRVRYNGLFDFDTLYAAIVDWGKNYGYRVHEKSYKHKVPSPKGAEQQIAFEMDKTVDNFVRYMLKVNIHTWDMMEVNVDVAGRKKQLTNARIEVQIQYVLFMDWQKKFSSDSSLVQLFSKMYFRLMKGTLEAVHFDGLHYRVVNFQAMIKKYFDLQAKANPYKTYLGEN